MKPSDDPTLDARFRDAAEEVCRIGRELGASVLVRRVDRHGVWEISIAGPVPLYRKRAKARKGRQ